MFKTIKLISFDITKTLITTSNEIGAEYLKIATKYGLISKSDEAVAKLNQSFEHNFKRLNQELPNFGLKANLSSIEWWSRLMLSTFSDAGLTTDANADKHKLEQIAAHLYKQYSRGNCWHLNPHARELLSDLRKQKPEITLAVASNFDERLETILRDLDIRHFFHFMFVSRQFGIAKPDPDFFRRILKTVEVEPNEYLHIGDDVHNDYFPIKQINAKGLIMDPSMEATKLPDVNPEDVIPDLKHFRQLILDENNEPENK